MRWARSASPIRRRRAISADGLTSRRSRRCRRRSTRRGCGSGARNRPRFSTRRSSTPTARWPRRRASARKGWTSPIPACGAITRWSCRWPTRRSRCILVNRSGNRPSAEGAAERFDQARTLCQDAGFRRITFRGDTDFSQTRHLDRWDADGVRFVFGYDARANVIGRADALPARAWTPLVRRAAVRGRRPSRGSGR